MTGKVWLVTGGGGDIGRATALEVARRGGTVLVTDIDQRAGKETVRVVVEAGGTATFHAADLKKSEDVRALVDETMRRYGRIDVLHNNAGVHETDLTSETTVEGLPEDVWDSVLEINVKATWMASKAVVPHMRRQGGGAIVNASSSGGLVGYPMGAAYCSSKGAVIQLTKVMAAEWARDNVRVNCYCPAAIDTRMVRRYLDAAIDRAAVERTLVGSHLIKRLGRPEEVARLVCFLASDDASFITGSAYVIDGGSLAWRGVD